MVFLGLSFGLAWADQQTVPIVWLKTPVGIHRREQIVALAGRDGVIFLSALEENFDGGGPFRMAQEVWSMSNVGSPFRLDRLAKNRKAYTSS